MSAPIEVRVKLTFPEALIRVPVLARLTRRFDVEPNIRRANVEEKEGWIVCELSGAAQAVEDALAWLRDEGVTVDLLGDVLEG
jgi:L-aspartate semialdehyde sulfurtransferase ferredoxin